MVILYLGTLLLTWFNFNPSMGMYYIHYKVCDEITYPFPKFNGWTIEVCKWISNFIAHFIGYVITYPCWDWSLTILVKGAPNHYITMTCCLFWHCFDRDYSSCDNTGNMAILAKFWNMFFGIDSAKFWHMFLNCLCHHFILRRRKLEEKIDVPSVACVDLMSASVPGVEFALR